ncbi:hypothetical protein [Paenarthrobacter nitroguajacolicus]|uniref:hypothetical protein n=1 Tax=Paenarthrobacter nitroguajacolicus TaxID=211146 RepID=UPI00248CCCED|nr:hypothetical protein [Paenarthrobacter nitroguajacolicus]MDI2036891.1 hypothetical protein [Paenarthrobacter nitroguajacolicus]
MRVKFILWRAPAIILAVLLMLMGFALSPAQAQFNDVESAGMPVAAAKIQAPAATAVSVTKSCDSFLWFGQAKISVGSYPVITYANYYELKVIDPDGVVQFTGDMSKSSGRSYSSGVQGVGNLSGTWTYQIRGYYKVPNSTNSWAGQPLTGTLNCP